jgi:DNA polymerase-1
MVRIQKALEEKGLKSKMILQVHDEFNFTGPENELQTLREIVTREMEMAINLQVPLKADTGYGKNWLEAHS